MDDHTTRRWMTNPLHTQSKPKMGTEREWRVLSSRFCLLSLHMVSSPITSRKLKKENLIF